MMIAERLASAHLIMTIPYTEKTKKNKKNWRKIQKKV